MIFKVEGLCPNCKKKGKKISLLKMKNHVDDISFLRDEFTYYICKNSACETVYFSIVSQFTTAQLNKEVGYKNSSSANANICYCYNIKKSQLNEHIIGFIESKMEEYPCDCATRNPYATCCRSEVKKLLKK